MNTLPDHTVTCRNGVRTIEIADPDTPDCTARMMVGQGDKLAMAVADPLEMESETYQRFLRLLRSMSETVGVVFNATIPLIYLADFYQVRALFAYTSPQAEKRESWIAVLRLLGFHDTVPYGDVVLSRIRPTSQAPKEQEPQTDGPSSRKPLADLLFTFDGSLLQGIVNSRYHEVRGEIHALTARIHDLETRPTLKTEELLGVKRRRSDLETSLQALEYVYRNRAGLKGTILLTFDDLKFLGL